MSIRAVTFSLALLTIAFAIAPAADAQNKRVLWDTNHGVYGSYSPGGGYSTLVSLLQASGIDVVESAAGVLVEDLSSYDAVVISVVSAYNSAYTAAEAQAVLAYATGGGGVLLIGDNANVWPGNVKAVGDVFDITLGVQTISPSSTYVTNLDGAEEMFEGIGSIYIIAGGELGTGASSHAVGTTANGDTAVARWDNGRVVALGDANIFDNPYINNVDNKAYSKELFEYLTQGCTANLGPGTSGTGGVVPLLSAGPGSCDGLLSLTMANAVGGSTALLMVGTQSAQIPAVGGTVYVDAFTPPFIALPLPLGGAPGEAGAGFTILAQNLSAYVPLSLTFQFAVFDSGAAYGVALSNGLELPMGL